MKEIRVCKKKNQTQKLVKLEGYPQFLVLGCWWSATNLDLQAALRALAIIVLTPTFSESLSLLRLGVWRGLDASGAQTHYFPVRKKTLQPLSHLDQSNDILLDTTNVATENRFMTGEVEGDKQLCYKSKHFVTESKRKLSENVVSK